jgi:hypothetical protein
MPIMTRRAYLIFGDIEGKLECCGWSAPSAPAGRYSVRELIEKYGRKANMMKWRAQLSDDRPRRHAHSVQERCDLICPDLPKIL